MGKKTLSAPVQLRLRELRRAKGWSQAELGDMIGVSDATINRIEQGKQNWNHEFLRAAAYALDCRIQDLFPPTPGSLDELVSGLDPDQREAARAMIDGLARARRSVR